MPIEVGATIAGLDALSTALDDAMRQSVSDAAHIIQRIAMQKAPVGVAGNSTNMPGDLRRSIRVAPVVGGAGTYTTNVGPYVVYGRQRELGGPIYPVTATVLAFTKFGESVFTSRVYQKPEPYLLPAELEAVPLIEAKVRANFARVTAGS